MQDFMNEMNDTANEIKERIEEYVKVRIQIKHAEVKEKDILKYHLCVIFLVFSYLGLMVSEIHYLMQMIRYKQIERECIKLQDISQIWPENEGRLVYLQGYI